MLRRRESQFRCLRMKTCTAQFFALTVMTALLGAVFLLSEGRIRWGWDTFAPQINATKESWQLDSSKFEASRALFTRQAQERRNALNHYGEKEYGLLYNLLVPEVFCEELVRVGKIGDGGKWVCNPFNLRPENNCAIFDMGVGGDISFSEEFQRVTNKRCRAYAFDKDDQSQYILEKLEKSNGEFKKALLGNKTNATTNQYTMKDLMAFYGLKTVEILKVDIEGAEFAVIPPAISSTRICQVLLEIHGKVKDVINLLKWQRQISRRFHWKYQQRVVQIGHLRMPRPNATRI